MRSAQTIPCTESAATNITREHFYDFALELSSAIHMKEVMKSNPKKVDPLAVQCTLFCITYASPALNSPSGQCVGFLKNL